MAQSYENSTSGERALALHPCGDSPAAATAQAMGLPVEAVLECVQELTCHA